MKISCSPNLSPFKNHRKSSASLGVWITQEIKSPSETQINEVFNSVKDIYDKENVVEAIKKLRSVHERVHFIDLLVKRKEEIDGMEELAQISKLGPIFERVKQKFMRKIKERKIMTNQTKTRSSLFRKNSILTQVGNNPSSHSSAFRKESEIVNERKKSDEIGNEERRKAAQRRSTVMNAITVFNDRKFFHQKEGKEADAMAPFLQKSIGLLNRKKSMPKLSEKMKFLEEEKNNKKMAPLTQRKSSLGNSLWNKEHVNHLQKDLFKHELLKENNDYKIQKTNEFEFDPYLNKNIQSIDSEVRRLLSEYKASKIKDYKTYLKKETNFQNNQLWFVGSPQKGKTKFVGNLNALMNENNKKLLFFFYKVIFFYFL